MRFVSLALMMMVSVPPVRAEEFPQQCYKELMLVILSTIEIRCDDLKLTLAGHRQKVFLGRAPDQACLSVAESKSRKDAADLQQFWCQISRRMINSSRPEPYVEAR